MKSVKILALAFGLIMLVSGAAFAQTQLTTTFSTLPVAPNAQTGLVGEVAFSALVPGTMVTGESITVTYDAPISSTSQIAVTVQNCNGGAPITTFGTPVACTGNGTPTVTVNVITATSATGPLGVVQLSFGGPAGSSVITTAANPVARIAGVRVNVNASGKTVGQFINASITGSLGLGTITNNVVPVAQVLEPIQVSASTFPQVPQAGGTSSGTVTVTELFANAFETQGATFPTQLILNVSAPAGFSFVSTGYTSNFQLPTTSCTTATGCASQGVIAQIASVSGNTITLNIISQNPQLLDSVSVPVTFSATAPVPLTPDNATVTATLAPPLPANTFVVGVGPTLGPDRYAVKTASTTISFKVGQAITLLYSTFNVWSTGFNTGFAIANPTGVIFKPAAGAVPAQMFFAQPQPGTVKVWLVTADGATVKTIDTATNKTLGLGLTAATGEVPAGGEWTVLLSDLATAAGLTSFQGQVFFQTNFSDAHGINFISDPLFSVTSQGYPMLVLTDNSLDN